jgi:WD40 repeat protein
MLRGHSTFVFDARFGPDDTAIVTSGLDGGVVLWDARSLRQVGRQIPSPMGGPALAWFSPDGSEVVSARLDQHEVWTWPADADAWLSPNCRTATGSGPSMPIGRASWPSPMRSRQLRQRDGRNSAGSWSSGSSFVTGGWK